MNLLTAIQQRLGYKLFLSYLVIVVVGVVVLAGTAKFHAPTALQHHVALMESLLGDNPALAADLRENFLAAVNEIMTVAAVAASLAALITSSFVARRIIDPIRQIMFASQRIAAGEFHERVQVSSEDELGALAQTFNRMATTLEQTERRRLELIGDVAHELRTPLSSIKSIMEGLVDGVLPSEPSTYVDVQREVARLQRLIHDLQELSRAEAGQISLDLRSVSPAKLIHIAADRLRPQFGDKDVNLHIKVSADIPPIRADPDRIIQVLLNLLGNALQYTPSGGKVTVQARCEGREVIVAVQDSGIGISPEHLPHIFDRFYRVDKSRSRSGGGSGIGLTIAKHLVEAHGGHISAESHGPNQGSTFTFTLPQAP